MEITSLNLSETKEETKFKSISPLEEKLIDVLKGGPLTRDQLVKKLEVPRTTIYDGLKKLIIRNEVKKSPVVISERNRGRPKILFTIMDE